jgi:hypothetical protein
VTRAAPVTQSSTLALAIAVLAVPAAAAAILTVMRPRLHPEASRSRRFLVVVGLTIAAQALHFVEELLTELYVVVPTTFELPPVRQSVFVGVNLASLGVWAASLIAVRRGFVIALLPLWFLGLCGVLNFFAHPYMAWTAGGYYSGVLTAPLVGVLGILTLRELTRVTAEDREASRGVHLESGQ